MQLKDYKIMTKKGQKEEDREEKKGSKLNIVMFERLAYTCIRNLLIDDLIYLDNYLMFISIFVTIFTFLDNFLNECDLSLKIL